MFDIGPTELLLVVVVAVVVIGPKDLPLALRSAGRWIGKMRKLSGHFRSGLDAMVREAELDEMEKKWKAQNEKIMRDHPAGTPAETERTGAWPAASAEAAPPAAPVISAAAPGEASPVPVEATPAQPVAAVDAPADPTDPESAVRP